MGWGAPGGPGAAQSPRERLSAPLGQRRDGGKKRRNGSGGGGHSGVPGTARLRERASARRGGGRGWEQKSGTFSAGGGGAPGPRGRALHSFLPGGTGEIRAGRGQRMEPGRALPPPPPGARGARRPRAGSARRAEPGRRNRGGKREESQGRGAPGIPPLTPGIRAAVPGPSAAAIGGYPGRRPPASPRPAQNEERALRAPRCARGGMRCGARGCAPSIPPFPLPSPFDPDLRAIFALARRRRPRARSLRLSPPHYYYYFFFRLRAAGSRNRFQIYANGYVRLAVLAKLD